MDELPSTDGDDRRPRPDPEATDAWNGPASPEADTAPVPAVPPAVEDAGLARFVRDVAEVGLPTAGDVAAFLDGFPPARRPRDARALARDLVAAGRLTPYQAGAILQGKAKGLVIGRYVVLDKLGAGGMGVVFKAEHRRLRRVVALKILPPSVTREPESVLRFHREAEAAAKLDHPNLVRALDADESGGMHFLVMEFVDGENLGKRIRRRGPLPVALAIDCAAQAARGLAAAHGQGIVHRDIKPSNLMLDAAGVVKVLDLGLARLDDPESPSDLAAGGLTLTNAFLGTADYMSPEQAFDPRLADARSDIYSLGCTLHYLLTGAPVYGGRSLMQRLLGHREGAIPSLRAARPDVPAVLDDAFRRMIAKAPDDRPRAMTEVVDLLDACRTAAASAPRSPRVLKVFDDGRPAPPPSPRPSRQPEENVDPTPLPRIDVAHAEDPSTPEAEGAGFRGADPSARVFTIHGVDALGFRRWVEMVRAEGCIPTSLAAFDGGDRPQFAAVAAPDRKAGPWEVMLHPDAVEFAKYASRKATQGLTLGSIGGYTTGSRSGLLTLYRRQAAAIGAEVGLDLVALRARLDDLERSLKRPLGLFGYPAPEGNRFAIVWGPDDGHLRRRDLDLTVPQLRDFLDHGARDGFRPVTLAAYAEGDAPRFAVVLRHEPGPAWESRVGLTAEALHADLARLSGRGLPPPVLCGYRDGSTTLYAAAWARGRAGRRA